MDTKQDSEKPAAETPAAETPAVETPAAETPAIEPPAAEPPKKKPLPWRILKGLLKFVGCLLAIVVLALLALPLWINPAATSLTKALVPGYTGTAFSLDRLNLNPYTGKLLIAGVKLENPKGYAEKDAFTLGSLSAEFETLSLLSNTIRVHDVTIDAPFASWVFDAEGTNNFDRIIAAVNEKLGPKKEKKKEPSETKVLLDKVTIKNVRVVVNTGVFELSSLTLSDFGKDTPAKLEIAGVKLVNPNGFPEPNAFSLKSLNVGMETADLSKKPLVFHDIIVDSTYAGLVYNDAGESNFDVILKPIKGGEEKDGKKEDVAKDEKKDEKKKAAEDDIPRVVIDKLDITGTKLQYRKVTLPIPLPTFNDIGKSSKDGATVKEVANQVVDKAKGAMSGLGEFASMIGSGAADLLGAGATNLLGNASELVSGGVSNVLGSASNVLGGASDAISGGASNVLSSAKGLLGGMLPGGGDEKKDEKKKDGDPGRADKAVESAKDAGKAIGEGAKNLGEGAKGAVEGMLKKVPNPFAK